MQMTALQFELFKAIGEQYLILILNSSKSTSVFLFIFLKSSQGGMYSELGQN